MLRRDKVGTQVFSTSAQRSCTKPVWEETFEFSQSASLVRFDVVDKDVFTEACAPVPAT